jgi:pimeloyl-ACP methyl ester carboxylesterase
MFDQGSGPPVVVVQPLQGRWQWMRRFLVALSTHYRVITYTLSGDFGADRRLDPALGFDQYVRQLEDVIDGTGVERAALCGISFGGTVALRYAARHPARVSHLIIASSPGPGWEATREQKRYISRPLLTLPIFLWTACRRLSAEMTASFPRPVERAWFVIRAGALALRYPALPHVMARRVRLMQTVDLTVDCAQVTAPTLIVTGDPALDHVVPVESTKRYLSCIRNSRYEIMDRTGHTGSLLQPQRLAHIVGEFIHASRS